jgi:hypothetical protein
MPAGVGIMEQGRLNTGEKKPGKDQVGNAGQQDPLQAKKATPMITSRTIRMTVVMDKPPFCCLLFSAGPVFLFSPRSGPA